MSTTTPSANAAALCAAVADVVAALTKVGALVAAGAATDVSAVLAARLVGELEGVLDVGEAAAAVLGRRADRSLELRAAGFASLRSYLITGVGLGQSHANTIVARGRSLETYPATCDAVLTGEVGLDAARVISEKVEHAICDLTGETKRAKRAEGEAVLLPLARALSVDDVATAGDKLTEVLDPQGRAERALRRFEQQSLACARVGDHYVVKGALPVDTGAGLVTILEAMVDQKFRTGSLREDQQRLLCDADVTEVIVATMVPGSRDRATMRDLARTDRDTRRAATTVDPHTLIDHCGHVLCVGRTHRTATTAQRTALTVRDRHCRFPGCRVDIHRCEAHHVQEWELGGTTCLANLVLLCQAHHMLVHEGGRRITADPPPDPGHPDHCQFQPPTDRRYESPLAGTTGLHQRHHHRPLAS